MFKKIKDFIVCKRKRREHELPPLKKKPRDCIICELCKDVIVVSRTLPCGDSFCEMCITEHFLSNMVHFT